MKKRMTKYEYGSLIARFLADKITPQEEVLLDEWLKESNENLQMFEHLINPWKAMWAKQWFKDAGIKTRGIKWKNMDGWYKPETPAEQVYYILAGVVFLVMVGVYLLIKLL
ncbi:MAG: hypothetical protein ABI415_07635 [Flavitalea sp.]